MDSLIISNILLLLEMRKHILLEFTALFYSESSLMGVFKNVSSGIILHFFYFFFLIKYLNEKSYNVCYNDASCKKCKKFFFSKTW